MENAEGIEQVVEEVLRGITEKIFKPELLASSDGKSLGTVWATNQMKRKAS